MQEVCHNGATGGFISKFGAFYKDYISAGEGAEVVEFDFGFLVLKNEANMVYIETIYVAPEHRTAGKGREMLAHVEALAAKEGKDGILGSCSPRRQGSTVSLKSMLACGFSLHSCEKDIIYLIKPLKGHQNG